MPIFYDNFWLFRRFRLFLRCFRVGRLLLGLFFFYWLCYAFNMWWRWRVLVWYCHPGEGAGSVLDLDDKDCFGDIPCKCVCFPNFNGVVACLDV